jgi:aminopeptidase N
MSAVPASNAVATPVESGPAALAPAVSSKAAECRLPTTVVPLHYHVLLRPDLAAAKFAGQLRVEVDVRSQTDTIVVNAAELEVQSAEIVFGVRYNGAVAPTAFSRP